MSKKILGDLTEDQVRQKYQHVSPFIDDGYTDIGFVAEIPRQMPSIRFQFRPALVEERAVAREKMEGRSVNEIEKITAMILVRHIVAWDLVNPRTSELVDISAKSLLMLKWPAFDALATQVLWGTRAPDFDPLSSIDRRLDQEEMLLESAVSGKPYADIQQENSVKN